MTAKDESNGKVKGAQLKLAATESKERAQPGVPYCGGQGCFARNATKPRDSVQFDDEDFV
jgi:hypothetical protein